MLEVPQSDEGNRKEDAKLSRSLKIVVKSFQNLKKCAGLSRHEQWRRRRSMKIKERGCKDAQVRGRQKINERRETRDSKMKHHENPKINAKEKYEKK